MLSSLGSASDADHPGRFCTRTLHPADQTGAVSGLETLETGTTAPLASPKSSASSSASWSTCQVERGRCRRSAQIPSAGEGRRAHLQCGTFIVQLGQKGIPERWQTQAGKSQLKRVSDPEDDLAADFRLPRLFAPYVRTCSIAFKKFWKVRLNVHLKLPVPAAPRDETDPSRLLATFAEAALAGVDRNLTAKLEIHGSGGEGAKDRKPVRPLSGTKASAFEKQPRYVR